MRFILINFVVLLILTSCANNSNEKLLNDRISVLSYESDLVISSNLKLSEINLSKAKNVNYWSQSGQNPQNSLPHFLANFKFKDRQKILKDNGMNTNTIQPIYFEEKICNVSSGGFLKCFNLETKEIMFSIDLKIESEEKYEIIRGGIAYFDGHIILSDGYGQVKVISSTDGSIIWEKNINLPILSAPIIYRNHIYFITSNNKIYALDFLSGNIKWSFQTIFDDKKSLFTGVPTAIGNIIIAPFNNGEIIAFVHDTGNIIWSENISKVSSLSNFDIKDIAANPVISENNVFTLSNNGRLVATNIVNGSLVWSLQISGSNSPIISNKQLYVVDHESRLLCINKLSGEIYWINQLEKNKNGKKYGKTNDWKGPYLINGLLYVLSTHGELLSISPTTSEILSNKNININGISIDPIIISNNIFIMDDKSNIYKLD